MKARSERILQFCAIMAVAHEYAVYCQEDLEDVFKGTVEHLKRGAQRQEMQEYHKGWGRLLGLLKSYSKINEEMNPEWYDKVVDRLVEVIREEVSVEASH